MEARYNKALPTFICLCPQHVKDNNRSPNHSKQSLPYLYHTNYTNCITFEIKKLLPICRNVLPKMLYFLAFAMICLRKMSISASENTFLRFPYKKFISTFRKSFFSSFLIVCSTSIQHLLAGIVVTWSFQHLSRTTWLQYLQRKVASQTPFQSKNVPVVQIWWLHLLQKWLFYFKKFITLYSTISHVCQSIEV